MTDPLDGVSLRLIDCIDDLFELKRWLGERRSVLGVDTETTGLDWWRDRLRTVQIGDALTGWTIPEEWRGAAAELLDAYEGDIVFHNMKFDLHFLELNGVHPRRRNAHDTRVMAHLIDPLRATGLKAVSARLISQRATLGDRVLKAAMRESGWTWSTVPTTFQPYWTYAALDTVLTARLFELMKPEIDLRYHEVYETEIASTLVLTDMERRGARIDRGYCRDMIDRIEPYLERLGTWCEMEFGVANINSDAQVIAFLHGQGVTWDKRTAKGHVALDKEVLAEIADRHPIVPALRAYRDASKLLRTYLVKYLELADANDLIHGSVNPLGARTGRMSISRPSMQNLPRSQHPRNAFIARETHVLGLIDYDQIEMRLLAHFANERAMIDAIAYGDAMTAAGYKGYDLHSMNARGIYGIDVHTPVPKAHRQVTKNSGFAKIYGAGVAQFARTAGISEDEAEAFLARYDHAYPGVTAFQSEVARVAARRLRTDGVPWVRAPSGRVHRSAKDKIYTLVNYLIQGCAADVLKRALIALDQHDLTTHLILPVHDELIFDLPRENAEEYMREVQRVVEDRTSFRVPLTADVELYPRWGDKYVGDNEATWTPPDLAEMERPYDD